MNTLDFLARCFRRSSPPGDKLYGVNVSVSMQTPRRVVSVKRVPAGVETWGCQVFLMAALVYQLAFFFTIKWGKIIACG